MVEVGALADDDLRLRRLAGGALDLEGQLGDPLVGSALDLHLDRERLLGAALEARLLALRRLEVVPGCLRQLHAELGALRRQVALVDGLDLELDEVAGVGFGLLLGTQLQLRGLDVDRGAGLGAGAGLVGRGLDTDIAARLGCHEARGRRARDSRTVTSPLVSDRARRPVDEGAGVVGAPGAWRAGKRGAVLGVPGYGRRSGPFGRFDQDRILRVVDR